ncbi:MAG TPA: rhomboid family intramembrane serine protease [Streptomyces sp.]|nr:rhomboid family intramembrane serine protease [Streptomyces sp.]
MEQHQSDRPHQSVACYRHPDRETGITCTRCERPICPDCMIQASVGFQCPECVRTGSGTGHAPRASRPRTLAGAFPAGDPRLVTKILIGLNVAVFILVRVVGERLTNDLAMVAQFPHSAVFPPTEGVAEGEWYRLVTSVFLHWQPWHIILNMLALWFLGPPLESALGRLRFTGLYLLSGLGGSALSYLLADPAQGSLGASGAIFGLFGATAVLVRRLRYDMRPIIILLVINLVFTFTWSNIAWQAHIGGLVVGAGIAYAMVHAPRKRRTLVQSAACGVALAAIVVVCVLRTLALTG